MHPTELHEAISIRGTVIEPEPPYQLTPVTLCFRGSRAWVEDCQYYYMPQWVEALASRCEQRDISRKEWLRTWHNYRCYLHYCGEIPPDNPKFNMDLLPKR